jgi:hypothetical protein
MSTEIKTFGPAFCAGAKAAIQSTSKITPRFLFMVDLLTPDGQFASAAEGLKSDNPRLRSDFSKRPGSAQKKSYHGPLLRNE